MPTLDSIIQLVITGAAIGFGSSIGTYMSNRAVLKRLDKLLEKKDGGAKNDTNKGENNREQQSGLCYR
jgi:hypothetical protein